MTQIQYKLYQYHSTELKSRIFYLFLTFILCFVTVFYNMEFILYKITPSIESLSTIQDTIQDTVIQNPSKTLDITTKHTQGFDFIFTDIFEAFLSYIVLSSYLSFLLSLPFIYYHLYKFLLPGLSYTESTLLRVLFSISLCLILFAFILTYTVILPYATSFFLTFQTGTTFFNESYANNSLSIENLHALSSELKTVPNVAFLSRIYSWILFLIHLFTAVSFLFQLPLILFALFLLILKPTIQTYFLSQHLTQKHTFEQTKRLTSSTQLNASSSPFSSTFELKNTTFLRKLLFFLLVLITAIFSPPDLYSQFFLFIPLFFIIEIFIFALFFYLEYIKLCSQAFSMPIDLPQNLPQKNTSLTKKKETH